MRCNRQRDRFVCRAARYACVALVIPFAAATSSEPAPLDAPTLKAAIEKSLALVERSGKEYGRQRDCFSCHHQSMSLFLLSEARGRGFSIDEDNFREQAERTHRHLKSGRENYSAGKGQGGRADTAGHALRTLEMADWEPDDVTEAVVDYLLQWSADSERWQTKSNRPPTQVSDFTTTYYALRGVSVFATSQQQDKAQKRIDQAAKWIARTRAENAVEAAYKLLSLNYLGSDARLLEAAISELAAMQRSDGGWGQIPDMAPDAYATAIALVALAESGGAAPTDPAFRRGIRFLLERQKDDGSWHVRSRSDPFQIYFESGYPHGDDQFLSIAAGCWATVALLHAHDAAKPAD